MLVFDLPVLRSSTPDETVHLLIYSARQIQRAIHGGSTVKKKFGIAKNPHSIRLRLLQSIPGVGLKRAEALLQAFGSVRACINANPTELCAVNGLGQEIAKQIHKTVNDPPARYIHSLQKQFVN
jgi:ERCC4-type nuclease